MSGKCRVGGGLQLAAQGGFLVGGDAACPTGWQAWGQVAGGALLPQPAGDAALADLKHLDKLTTRHATCVGGEYALAQIDGICFHICNRTT